MLTHWVLDAVIFQVCLTKAALDKIPKSEKIISRYSLKRDAEWAFSFEVIFLCNVVWNFLFVF